jgi:hypothetical protein
MYLIEHFTRMRKSKHKIKIRYTQEEEGVKKNHVSIKKKIRSAREEFYTEISKKT